PPAGPLPRAGPAECTRPAPPGEPPGGAAPPGPAPDGALTLRPPGPSAEQQWMLSTSGDGHHTLVNSATGTLLDVTGASTADGAPVGTYRPNTGRNQSWTFATDPAGG
ncbi:RICIN domain-containing protein, partial [Streptomyces erythrochromogenes]|uniref:RICIN domain-containing protein n=2 Tax=Streptomyces erythrochromogenes TaxID=285574 RepID=UPI00362B2571